MTPVAHLMISEQLTIALRKIQPGLNPSAVA